MILFTVFAAACALYQLLYLLKRVLFDRRPRAVLGASVCAAVSLASFALLLSAIK